MEFAKIFTDPSLLTAYTIIAGTVLVHLFWMYKDSGPFRHLEKRDRLKAVTDLLSDATKASNPYIVEQTFYFVYSARMPFEVITALLNTTVPSRYMLDYVDGRVLLEFIPVDGSFRFVEKYRTRRRREIRKLLGTLGFVVTMLVVISVFMTAVFSGIQGRGSLAALFVFQAVLVGFVAVEILNWGQAVSSAERLVGETNSSLLRDPVVPTRERAESKSVLKAIIESITDVFARERLGTYLVGFTLPLLFLTGCWLTTQVLKNSIYYDLKDYLHVAIGIKCVYFILGLAVVACGLGMILGTVFFQSPRVQYLIRKAADIVLEGLSFILGLVLCLGLFSIGSGASGYLDLFFWYGLILFSAFFISRVMLDFDKQPGRIGKIVMVLLGVVVILVAPSFVWLITLGQ